MKHGFNKMTFVYANPRMLVSLKCFSSENLDDKYTDTEKQKILEVINSNNNDILLRYDISKARLKKFNQWKASNGEIKSISDIEYVEGFSEKSAKKLFNSILSGPSSNSQTASKIKGNILYPSLSESVVKDAKTTLSVYITVNSVCWSLIEKNSYEVVEWMYHTIEYPKGKKMQISDMLDISWSITEQLPTADIYVMKAEPTTLRAGGNDPNNPKVIAVNLQKAQMIAMIVALINAREFDGDDNSEESQDRLKHKVYFLRPTLPFRLYGTLVGNERVSTEQTVDMLLKTLTTKSNNHSHAYINERLQNMFRSQKDLQKDMLGQCLLLSLTFMDLCVYRNQERINALMKRRE
ncbi:hypothetical protein K1T71_005937 [Dendrolimus kikuchii]|uniref:Uncharacterized protein n=1 Tax=Dendrolimus kikuchii TaxID=765133 RepID=A0ACC1D2E3_9NEOP|nr:hypothetical protein K1T71_005937 [Dendrolimus kikuchii]